MKTRTFLLIGLLSLSPQSFAVNFYWESTLFGAFFNTGDLGSSWEEACQNLYTQQAIDAWNNNGGVGLFDYHPIQYPDLIHPSYPDVYKGCTLEDRSPRNGRLRSTAYVLRKGDSCPVDSSYNSNTGACECDNPNEQLNPTTQQCEVPVDGPKNQGRPECPQCIETEGGNPIHLGTGNKFQTETDYVSNQQGGLRYRRYYNSHGDGLPTRYGNGWSADYWQRIVPISATEMEIRRPDGKYFRFNLVNNVWTPDADVVLQLEELTDAQNQRTGWLLTLANDTVEEYNSINDVGRPIAITTRKGLTTTLEYELTVAEGFDGLWNSLDRVTDPYGRTLEFYYDTNAHLVMVKDPAGNEIRYTRDANNNFASVIYPDGTPNDNSDNPARVYHYEDSNHVNALTGITDETGNRYATWAYDAQGRAILSEHANGAERINIVYNNDGTTTVTESNGSTRTYSFETILGVVKPTNITGDKCVNCGSDVESVTHDANGYPTSETDYNGNVTNFVYDARGLQTSRTEAVGTSEERTITTEWHPTLRLPTKITEPGKITTFVYDAQGRLLEREEENQ